MTLGTLFLGKVKSLNNQFIETKFFAIGIPIYPVSSIYVTEKNYNQRLGLALPLNKTSVIAGYMRFYIGALAVFCLLEGELLIFAMGISPVNHTLFILLKYLLVAIFILIWAYFMFYFGKSTKAETDLRNKVGKVTGYYIVPSWFDHGFCLEIYDQYAKRYKEMKPNGDWRKDISTLSYADNDLSIYYVLSLFNYVTEPNDESYKLFEKADGMFN